MNSFLIVLRVFFRYFSIFFSSLGLLNIVGFFPVRYLLRLFNFSYSSITSEKVVSQFERQRSDSSDFLCVHFASDFINWNSTSTNDNGSIDMLDLALALKLCACPSSNIIDNFRCQVSILQILISCKHWNWHHIDGEKNTTSRMKQEICTLCAQRLNSE